MKKIFLIAIEEIMGKYKYKKIFLQGINKI